MSPRIDLNPQDIIRHLKMTGVFNQNVNQVLRLKIAAARAAEKGIQVGDDEVETALKKFRSAKGLKQEGVFQDWLKKNSFSEEEIKACLKEEICSTKVFQNVSPDNLDGSLSALVAGGLGFSAPSLIKITTPYTRPTSIKPIFNPYSEEATENAVAGVRG